MNYKALFRTVTLLAAVLTLSRCGASDNSPFLIITDNEGYDSLRAELGNYGDLLTGEGYNVRYLHEDWTGPDNLRDTLAAVYSENGIEGAVFIGNIPIAMIRGAQHLASAFKMDEERFGSFRASVPSDRFYDDLDLKFEFIEKDSLHPGVSYYEFSSDSPQRIDRDFYTARITPGTDGNYEQIRNYLRKVISIRRTSSVIDSVLTFSGHGYNSESLIAWEGHSMMVNSQFPQLFDPGSRLENYHFTMDREMKTVLTDRLSETWDIAVFHAHGADDAQYLLGYPVAANTTENIESVKLYLRGKLRQAKRWKQDPEEAKARFMESLGVPESWFEGTFEDTVIRADSLMNANLDFYLDDLHSMTLNPRFFIFDECFNGSFHQPDYIAGAYLFGDGRTITAMANSVNVKQDIWPQELMDMLNFGFTVGEWHKNNSFLESHLLGDPTLHFTASKKLPRFIQKFPASYLDHPDPSVRSLAVYFLRERSGKDAEAELVRVILEDTNPLPRLLAARYLAEDRSPEFYRILPNLLNDPYELTRRFAAHWIGRSGLSELAGPLVRTAILDPGKRVRYAAGDGCDFIGHDQSLMEAPAVFANMIPNSVNKEREKTFVKGLERSRETMINEVIPALTEDTMAYKQTVNVIRRLRNYPYTEALDPLMKFCADTSRDETQRVIALEALGWYHMHSRWQELADFTGSLADDTVQTPAIRAEAEKTRRRLIIGPNQPLSP